MSGVVPPFEWGYSVNVPDYLGHLFSTTFISEVCDLNAPAFVGVKEPPGH